MNVTGIAGSNNLMAEMKEDGSLNDKLKKATQDFEAYFVGEMLKGMRKTVPEGGLIKKGHGEKIYEEMLDVEMASHISKGKGLGLAEIMFAQLKEEGNEISK